MCLQKLVLCEFHCKPWPSGVSLESPGLEKKTPNSGKSSRSSSKSRCAQGGVGYSMSLKVKWAIFRPRSSKVSVEKVFLCPFRCKPRPSRVSLESPGLEKKTPNSRKSSRSLSKTRCSQGGLGYSISLKVKWGYITTQKLESER